MLRRAALMALAAGPWAGLRAAVGPTAAASASGAFALDEIVARHVAARGGLEAWRRIDSIGFAGHVESARGGVQRMPFTLEVKRPNKTRFELTLGEQRQLRVFDGAHGWKLKPGSSGAPELKPFSPEEVRFAQDETPVDGLLIDHAAKGIELTLEGADEALGRKAYRVLAKLPSGAMRRIWIDAASFLDLRFDRPSWSPIDRGAAVSTLYSDFRAVDGVLLPAAIETGTVATGRAWASSGQKLLIERMVLNPALPEQAFARPLVPHARHATVSVGGAPAAAPPMRAERRAP